MADLDEGNLPSVEPVAETTTESNSLDKILSEALDKSDDPDIARDERGRFATKNTEPEADAEGTVAAEETPDAKPAEVQPLEPHPRWSADLKAQFSEWPRNVQEAFLARHNEVDATLTRKTQEIAEFRKTAEPLVQAVQPFGEYLNSVSQALGTSPPALVQELLKTEYSLRTGTAEQKMMALAHIAQSYGINLAALTGSPENGQSAYRPDPFVNQLYQTMPAVQSELAEMRQFRSEIEHERLSRMVETFATEKDATGQLKHPHFDALRPQIGALMSTQGLTLEDAYAKAVEPFSHLLQQQSSAAKEAEEKAKREAIEKAKKAAPVGRSSGSVPRGTSQAKGLDALLASSLDRAGIN